MKEKNQKNVRKNAAGRRQGKNRDAEKVMNRWGKVNFFMLAMIFAYILGRDAGLIDISDIGSAVGTIGGFVVSAFVQVVLESLLAKVVNAK